MKRIIDFLKEHKLILIAYLLSTLFFLYQHLWFLTGILQQENIMEVYNYTEDISNCHIFFKNKLPFICNQKIFKN